MSGQRVHREFLELAAARMDEPLAPSDDLRLEAHLASCDACRERIAGYEADRAALHEMRELPPPPRDLWARTSAALDREQGRRLGWRSRIRRPWAAGRAIHPRTRGALAAALSVLVIVALVGSGLVPGFPGGGPSGIAQSTPFSVEPRALAYVSRQDGNVSVYVGQIDRVCPESAASTCLPIDAAVRRVASFANDFVPQQLSVSPDGTSGAVVGTSASGGGVYALRFPELPEPSPATSPSSAITGTATGSEQPTSSVPATGAPTGVSPSIEPSNGPQPEAIIEHVIVVGESPAYSADGTMLAFSAMPADRSRGPDIYLWHVGAATALAVTHDHGSIFASWAGAAIVGSRGGAVDESAGAAAGAVTPVSYLLDPVTLETRDLAHPAWRPIVDPTGRFVIYWDGSLAPGPDGLTWQEDRGGLYLAPWQRFLPGTAPVTEPSPEATSVTSPTTEASNGQPSAGVSTEAPSGPPPGTTGPPGARTTPRAGASEAPVTLGEPQQIEVGRDYAKDPILSWEVRWSPDGAWFGAWIGEQRSGRAAGVPEPGTLTVGALDRATGRVAREPILDHAPAVRGFALGEGRVAWATVPGADGKSEVRLLVWSDKGRGVVNTTPGRGNDSLPAF